MEEKKVVLKLDLHDDKAKQKALKAVSSLSGIDSISMDMKGGKMTVIGTADPVDIVNKLRKTWYTDILSIGPAKEAKKDEPKKQEDKKDAAAAKNDGNKKDSGDQVAELVKMYKAYQPHYTTHYTVHSCEEDPNACAIM